MTEEMREWPCDVGIVVRAPSAEEAAQIVAAILAAGTSTLGHENFRPAFIGVRNARERKPEPSDQAHGVFDRIMGSPSA